MIIVENSQDIQKDISKIIQKAIPVERVSKLVIFDMKGVYPMNAVDWDTLWTFMIRRVPKEFYENENNIRAIAADIHKLFNKGHEYILLLVDTDKSIHEEILKVMERKDDKLIMFCNNDSLDDVEVTKVKH